jgi:hypothetical protein
MARAVVNLDLEANGPFDVMFGCYEVGRYRIPYMLCTLSAEECGRTLNLASEDAELTLASGKVEELFQRDIDHERVAQMAEHYLSASNVPQRPPFFNSLTIALLYKGRGVEVAPRKAEADSYSKEVVCGPVLVRWDESRPDDPSLPRPGAFGSLYWNRHGVRAVAIDGQHRLAALQQLAKQDPAGAARIRVSVIVLLLDEKFGVRADGKAQIELMRSLFIDLNKHAQKVVRARQLLLDDSDPLAVALRSAIGQELKFVATSRIEQGLPVGQTGEFLDRLPLSLVDWHGEQRAKVDAGPYLVSVLGLEWALSQLCESQRFGKRLVDLSVLYENAELLNGSRQQAAEYYVEVRKKLEPWLVAMPQLTTAISAAETNGSPFYPNGETVRKMGEQIAAIWAPAITRLLCTAAPYRRLVDFAIDNRLLDGEFSNWYQAEHAAETAAPIAEKSLKEKLSRLETQLESREAGKPARFRDHLGHIDSRIKCVAGGAGEGEVGSEPHLLFSLTGQRALFLSLRQIFDACGATEMSARKLAQELALSEPRTESASASFVAHSLGTAISHWDEQLGGRFFAKSARAEKISEPVLREMPTQFWRGSLLKRESLEAIDFSNIAAERTARTITFLWALWVHRRCHPTASSGLIREWTSSGNADSLRRLDETATGAHLKKALLGFVGLDRLGGASHDANKFPLAFLAKLPIHDEEPLPSELFPKFAWSRIKWAWEMAAGR